VQATQSKLDDLKKETGNVQTELEKLRMDNQKLMSTIEQLKLDKQNIESQLYEVNQKTRANMFETAIDKAINLISKSLNRLDDPVLLNCKSSAEYLLTLVNPNATMLDQLRENFVSFKNDSATGKFDAFQFGLDFKGNMAK
jgi:hypothetical protein